jgi:ABC-type lipoprotein release transport system permease subunit
VRIGNNTPEIIGIVRDAQINRLGPPQPAYFAPFSGGSGLVVLVPASFASQAAASVRRIEARAATEIIPLSERFYAALGDSRGAARIAGALGILALLLATIGVYGVVSYSVEQRRKEIGIRMALGARPGEVVGMILRRNSRALLCGLAIGLALAGGVSVVLQHEFYGTNPFDPLAYAAVLALLFLAGAAACVIPARRAARTDALIALHHE